MTKKLNTLGQAVVSARDKVKLDEVIKRLLSHKQVLAWILQYTVPEFKNLSREEIAALIENPSVGKVPVTPGSTNNMIDGLPQEDIEMGEEFVTYDVRFFVRTPEGRTPAEYRLIINIEAQGSPYRPYDLESRGILYCSRMLSEQIGRNVTNGNYQNLQKVYSIWIVMNCPQKDANTVSECGIYHRNVIGEYHKEPRVDLMRVVMIRLPKDGEVDKAKNPASRLHGMLSTLLSGTIPPEEKLEKLDKEYGIKTTEEIRKEAEDMCNYSSVIEQNGIEKGIKQGIEQGIEKGAEKNARDVALRMIRADKYNDEEISDISGLTADQIETLRRQSAASF